METQFKQTRKISAGGSIINLLMGNNKTLPKVGEGATILSYTDRHAYEVMSVSEDYKTVVIQQYNAKRIDKNGMSEVQDYEYKELNGHNETIVWRRNAWYKKCSPIYVLQSWIDSLGEKYWCHPDYKELFKNGNHHLPLIPGKTEQKVEYSKISILWGVKDQYHDYSF